MRTRIRTPHFQDYFLFHEYFHADDEKDDW